MCKFKRIVLRLLRSVVLLSVFGKRNLLLCSIIECSWFNLGIYTTNGMLFGLNTGLYTKVHCLCWHLSWYHQLWASSTKNSHPKDSSISYFRYQSILCLNCNLMLGKYEVVLETKDQAQACSLLRHKLVSKIYVFEFLYLLKKLQDLNRKDKKMAPLLKGMLIICSNLQSLRMILKPFSDSFYLWQNR